MSLYLKIPIFVGGEGFFTYNKNRYPRIMSFTFNSYTYLCYQFLPDVFAFLTLTTRFLLTTSRFKYDFL